MKNFKVKQVFFILVVIGLLMMGQTFAQTEERKHQKETQKETDANTEIYVYSGKIPGYDPSKEPSFNKKEIEKKVDEISMKKNAPADFRHCMLNTFLEKRLYKAAQYTWKYYRKINQKHPEIGGHGGYLREDQLCFLDILIGNFRNGEQCLWNYYINRLNKYNKNEIANNKKRIRREFDVYYAIYLYNPCYNNPFPYTVCTPYVEDRLNYVLRTYPDLPEDELGRIQYKRKGIKERFLKREIRRKIPEFHRMRNETYNRLLNKLLDFGDEKRLRKFFQEIYLSNIINIFTKINQSGLNIRQLSFLLIQPIIVRNALYTYLRSLQKEIDKLKKYDRYRKTPGLGYFH